METRDRITYLGDVCSANLLNPKWLIAPSRRVGHQWIEGLVRRGQSVMNLHPTTVSRLALEVVGPELAEQKLTVAGRGLGPLIIDAAWNKLDSNGYLGRLIQSAALSTALYESLMALRMAGSRGADLDAARLESAAKAQDLVVLLDAYEEFLASQSLVDEADVLRRAIRRLHSESNALERDSLIFVPVDLAATGLERQFLAAIPAAQRITIRHPIEPQSADESQLRFLAKIGETAGDLKPTPNRSVRFFRAVGEINEIREVLRRCLAEKKPLDEVELLYTDAETYLPLIYSTSRRYFAEPDRPDGIPVTFAEGIPASLSRPGRALANWLRWIHENYPQRLLVEMIGEGLLNCGDEEISFSYLVRLLRPIGIGVGADRYLPKLEEQIKALRKSTPKQIGVDQDEEANRAASLKRKLKGLMSLQKLVKQLLQCSQNFSRASGSTAFGRSRLPPSRDPIHGSAGASPSRSALQAAEEFLKKSARSISELDRFSCEALVEQIQERTTWLDRLNTTFDVGNWLAALPAQARVFRSGPRPGHLHVAHIHSGGQSGRGQTFVVGLDDRRFPGASLQDPILLDRERTNLNPELSTSAARLRQKINEFAASLSRLTGSVTLSWSCQDLSDDRETFPSSAVLSAYRLVSGHYDADLDALNAAIGPPCSFAPTSDEKALDESERWLWLLSDQKLQGANQTAFVEAHFPHLARGSAAQRQRFAELGAFNGWVPQAGADLNPFKEDGPVLSASALETAGRCPLAYFFRSGLRLYPLDEMELDQDRWLDARQFGLLLHDVFRQVMSELASEGKRPDFERDHVRLAKILQDAVQKWRQDVPPPNENAFRMQYWRLVKTSRIFLQAEEAFCRQSQPRFFEVALGLENKTGGSALDDAAPVTVILPNGKTICTKGQIDRVDETGNQRFAVWDYKLASGYGYDRVNPFQQGRRVQSVLYMRMMETALRNKLDPQAVVERFGYFFPSVQAYGLRVDWNANELAAGMKILEQLCSFIADGVFPATDQMDDCRYCHYAMICRDLERVTSHSKSLLDRNDVAPLVHLRGLRRG